jgi:hypothetical protein
LLPITCLIHRSKESEFVYTTFSAAGRNRLWLASYRQKSFEIEGAKHMRKFFSKVETINLPRWRKLVMALAEAILGLNQNPNFLEKLALVC